MIKKMIKIQEYFIDIAKKELEQEKKFEFIVRLNSEILLRNKHLNDLQSIQRAILELIRCAGHPNNALCDYERADYAKKDTSGLMVVTVNDLKELLGGEG